MAKRIYVGLEVEGSDDPVGVFVEFEGVEDAADALEKIKVFEGPLFMKARIKGFEKQVLNVRIDSR